MRIIPGLICTFLFTLFLMLLPYAVYHLLAANVDMPEEVAERFGLSIYGAYVLVMVGIVGRAIWSTTKATQDCRFGSTRLLLSRFTLSL